MQNRYLDYLIDTSFQGVNDDDHRCLRTHTHSNRDSCAGQGLRLHGGCCRYTVDDVIQRFAFALHHTDYVIYIRRLGFVMPTGLRSAVGY